LYLLNAGLANDSDLAPVVAPGKVAAIIGPSTCLARLVFMCRHKTQTKSIFCHKNTTNDNIFTTTLGVVWYMLQQYVHLSDTREWQDWLSEWCRTSLRHTL